VGSVSIFDGPLQKYAGRAWGLHGLNLVNQFLQLGAMAPAGLQGLTELSQDLMMAGGEREGAAVV
jgi:hypothetical protein